MKNKKNELNELLQKEVNIQFAFACLNNDIGTVKEYIENEYINNLGYEGGMFAIYAAMKGNVEILDILYKSQRDDEIKQYQHDIFNTAASYGNINCVKFLLEKGANPKELENSTSYNNYHEVEEMFITYEKEHPNTVKVAGGIITLDDHNESD